MDKKIEIPYLKYVYYDQKRSEELGLNHTLSIIMNYFAFILPLWGERISRNGKDYFWITRSKVFDDMPSIQIAEVTLKNYIAKLVKEGLLERHIYTSKENGENGKSKGYYRATEKYTKGEDGASSMNFILLYNNLEILLKEGRINPNEKEKLIKLISSYSGMKKKNDTTYNLEGIGGTEILDLIRRELELSERGEGVVFNVGREINREWVLENITKHIIKKGKLHGWIEDKNGGTNNDYVKNFIVSTLDTLFRWHKENNVEIKNMKLKIDRFFGKSFYIKK